MMIFHLIYLGGHRAEVHHLDLHNFRSNAHIYDKLRVLHMFERLAVVLVARIVGVNSDHRYHVRRGTVLQLSLRRMLTHYVLGSNYPLSIDRCVLIQILGGDSHRQSHPMDRSVVGGSDEVRRDGEGHFVLSDVCCDIRMRLDEQYL